MARLAALAGLAAAVSAAPSADLVKSLPGYGATPTTWYSGYLDIPGSTKHLHYTFITSSAGLDAPLLAWFNGGPGCSSLEGLFGELGQLHVNGATPGTVPTNPPSLYFNSASWANFTNQLFIEAPACVGFSYADDPRDCAANDTTSGDDNLQAMLQFYKKFPELVTNDLIVAGESYAGIYVPQLSMRIVQHNAAGKTPAIPLKGVAVGNAVLGGAFLNPTRASFSYPLELQVYTPFFRGHGLISKSVMAAIDAACPDVNDPAPGAACGAAIQQAHNEIGQVDVYNIYAACDRPTSSFSRAPGQDYSSLGLTGPVECVGGYALIDYLNRPSVVAALNVAPGLAGGWSTCTGNSSFHYTRTEADQRYDAYPVIFGAGVPVLAFSGEADACIPWLYTEAWTSSFNFSVADGWRTWMFNNDTQAAGYQITYNTGKGSTLSFATVLEAGHMVPEYAPQQAWTMMNRFVNGQPL